VTSERNSIARVNMIHRLAHARKDDPALKQKPKPNRLARRTEVIEFAAREGSALRPVEHPAFDLNEAFGRTDRAGRPRRPGGEDDGNANKEGGDGNARGQSAARESHSRQCKGAHRDRGERKGRNSACPKHSHSRRKSQKHAPAAAAGPERLVDKLFAGRCCSTVLRQPLYCSDEFFLARIPEPPPRPDQRPVLQSK
jgi:hypothetical protein